MKNQLHPDEKHMSFVNGKYRVHDSLQEARNYELIHLGYTSWSADRNRFKISLPRPLFKGLISAIIIQSIVFTLVGLAFLFTFVSCKSAERFNDPKAMREVKREMKHAGQI